MCLWPSPSLASCPYTVVLRLPSTFELQSYWAEMSKADEGLDWARLNYEHCFMDCLCCIFSSMDVSQGLYGWKATGCHVSAKS